MIFSEDQLEYNECSDFDSLLKSEEEIASLTTNESWTDGQRAIFIINEGRVDQKIAILSNLDFYIQESTWNEIISSVMQNLRRWEESLQGATGDGFIKLLDCPLLSSQDFEKIMIGTVTVLGIWTPEIIDSWIAVFGKLCLKASRELILKHFIQFVINQADNSQHYMTRANAAILIGKLMMCNYDLPLNLADTAIKLSKDLNDKIRLTITEQLPLVIKKYSREYESAISGELLNLVNDKVLEVKLSAIKSCIEAGEFMQENRKNNFMNIICLEWFKTNNSKIFEEIAKNFGKLVYNWRFQLKSEEFKNEVISLLHKMSSHSSSTIRKYACYNFPAILLSLGAQSYCNKVKDSYERFSRDSNNDIRKICASQFHEVANILSPKISQLFPTFHILIRDPSAQWSLIPNIRQVMKNITIPETYFEILNCLIQLLGVQSNWRDVKILLDQLGSLLSDMDMNVTLNCLVPKLMDLMHHGSLPLKQHSSQLLLEIFRKIHQDELKHNFSSSIAQSFANSSSSYDRILYIDFCLQTKGNCSRNMFKNHFLQNLLQLATDRVDDVRYKFIREFPGIRERVSTADRDSSHEIDAILDEFVNDRCKKIKEKAYEIQQIILNERYWQLIDSPEELARERQLMSLENEVRTEDAKSKDSPAKRQIAKEKEKKKNSPVLPKLIQSKSDTPISKNDGLSKVPSHQSLSSNNKQPAGRKSVGSNKGNSKPLPKQISK
ncbi:PPP4R4_6 [Blepharisma stoltei]|uniref:Uncharacterized protein n=1 Tax=Blepharisma stoltei TaxID=1481888 RepID=A0AAU9K0A9_9CILI|nr:unnamed protein product [Blepharisma stoltei]